MGPTKTEPTIQLGCLPGSDVLLLHIQCYGCAALCSYGTTNSGNKGYLWFFWLLFGPFSFHWFSLSSLNMRRCAQYFCNLIWHVCLISLGSLPLSEGKQRRTESWGEGKWEGPERTEWRGNCYWDRMYERIHSIYYVWQKKINCRTRKCNLDRNDNKKKKSRKHVYFKTFIPKKIKHSLVILSICETLHTQFEKLPLKEFVA